MTASQTRLWDYTLLLHQAMLQTYTIPSLLYFYSRLYTTMYIQSEPTSQGLTLKQQPNKTLTLSFKTVIAVQDLLEIVPDN